MWTRCIDAAGRGVHARRSFERDNKCLKIGTAPDRKVEYPSYHYMNIQYVLLLINMTLNIDVYWGKCRTEKCQRQS